MLILATVFSPHGPNGEIRFWQANNIANVMRQITDIGILAIGMTLVIMSGGIDLSMGSLLAVSCTIFAHVFTTNTTGFSAPMALLLAIGATTLFGALNGFVITRLSLQPFIVTLATMIGSRGFAKWLVENQTIAIGYDDRTKPIVEFLGQKSFVVPAFLAFATFGVVLLNTTKFGRYLVAIGGNEHAARLSGINVDWAKLRVYTLSGFIAGCAGVLYCCETHQGSANAGISYELDAIAAAVIGGTSLAGGKGGIFGTFVGALALGILTNLLGLRNVDENMQWMLKAAIIVFAVWLQSVGTRRRA